MSKRILFIGFLVLSTLLSTAQETAVKEHESFKIEKVNPHLPIISQGNTGTCWSFATASFLESELLRQGKPEVDLSEMFFVYYAYKNKADDYLRFHGHNNLNQGGQAHDVMDVIREHGAVPYKAYPGKKVNGKYAHNDLVKDVQKKTKKLNSESKFKVSKTKKLNKTLKHHLGKLPKEVEINNQKYSPVEYAKSLDINPDDYIELTSYSHHPFYKPFVLEIPDNWSHDLYYNLPIKELMEVMNYAIDNGFTIAWDGDMSEKTFEHKKGIADVENKYIGKVDQKLRQKTFENRSTTDDHLMHIVGTSKKDDGRKAFYTKNSWGQESNPYGGYLHMTEDYVKLKTVAIMVHKDAIPEHIMKKLKI